MRPELVFRQFAGDPALDLIAELVDALTDKAASNWS